MKRVFFFLFSLSSSQLSWLWCDALAESVALTTEDVLQVTHTAGAGCVSSLGLLTPVIFADLGEWITARRATLLLDVVRATTATTAERV